MRQPLKGMRHIIALMAPLAPLAPLALFGIGGFAAETKALPVFYAVVAYENALVPAAPQVLYEVDFAGGGVQEIGEIGIEATAFTAEPGTGRLLAWVDEFGSGLYEIEPHTGASSLLGAAPSGTGIDVHRQAPFMRCPATRACSFRGQPTRSTSPQRH